MPKFTAQWISENLQSQWKTPPVREFTAVEFDSRLIKPGGLFVAMKGARHGHEFLQSALENGAIGAIVEKHHPTVALPQIVVGDSLQALQRLAIAYRKTLRGKVIALTGSSGKTSSKELLAKLLGPETHKTQGNFNNHIGLPLTLLRAPQSAPYIIVEAGINQIGEMDLLADIASPDMGLINFIGTAHQEFFGDLQTTAREKGKLLQAIPSSGQAFLHADEMEFDALRELKCNVEILGDTTAKLPSNYKSTLCAVQELPAATTEETWGIHIGNHIFTLPLVTPGMARNAALCIAVALHCAVDSNTINLRLARPGDVDLRGTWKPTGKYHTYMDAYNANPEALADALWRFQKLSADTNPRHYVIGEMGELGENSAQLHLQSLSALGLRPIDQATLIGEHAPQMHQGLLHAGASVDQIAICDDLDEINLRISKINADTFIKGSHSTKLYTLDVSCLVS